MSVMFSTVAVVLVLNAAALVGLVLVQKTRAVRSVFGSGHDVISPAGAQSFLFRATAALFISFLTLTGALNLLAR